MVKPTYIIAACLVIFIALGVGIMINESLIQV